MADHTEPRITFHSHFLRGRALASAPLIADTCNAIELRKHSYPQRPDLQKEHPRADVDMSKLSVSVSMAFYPFKGDTIYYSLPDLADVAWSYERLVDDMQAIAGRLAFDASKVTELVA